jgi:ketosteroid isomerase-like protein
VWTGAWKSWRVEIQDIIDASDHVVVVARESGRGKGSGIELDQVTYGVFTLRDGKILRWKGFIDRHQAFEAAGLRA